LFQGAVSINSTEAIIPLMMMTSPIYDSVDDDYVDMLRPSSLPLINIGTQTDPFTSDEDDCCYDDEMNDEMSVALLLFFLFEKTLFCYLPP
jgi:hypothetical protein